MYVEREVEERYEPDASVVGASMHLTALLTWFDRTVADIFGYHALQLGLPEIDALREFARVGRPGEDAFAGQAEAAQRLVHAGQPGANGLGTLQQGYVETSNVNVVEELVAMIATQRAYELNSKAIQTSDQMLQKLAQL